MRLNKFIAQATGLSRRKADSFIELGKVIVNGKQGKTGQDIQPDKDQITLNNIPLSLNLKTQTIILNKPSGFIVSRDGQGNKTIYDLLPPSLQLLKPIGRLDKNSSGLLLLTNDGQLAQQLTHPSYQKIKIYNVKLNQPLLALHRQMINDIGINLSDGNSQLLLQRLKESSDKEWQITMREGRNRQIRRTFEALGYRVTYLHRITFGDYHLDNLASGSYKIVEK